MTTLQLLTDQWRWSWPVIIGSLLLIFAHLAMNRYRLTRGSIFFGAGILLLLLTMLSPLEFLGRRHLFSAHMVQHILLLMVIPPLLVAGLNREFPGRLFKKPGMKKLSRWLLNPFAAWLLGVGSMWFWHIPALFRQMGQYPALHSIQVLSLLAIGVIFCWPVLSPLENQRLEPLQSVAYLFTACIGCTVLGIIITFAPAGLYTTHSMAGAAPGMQALIQGDWGITPAEDQQLGGLIMWVPACLIYLAGVIIKLAQWYSAPEAVGYHPVSVKEKVTP